MQSELLNTEMCAKSLHVCVEECVCTEKSVLVCGFRHEHRDSLNPPAAVWKLSVGGHGGLKHTC